MNTFYLFFNVFKMHMKNFIKKQLINLNII